MIMIRCERTSTAAVLCVDQTVYRYGKAKCKCHGVSGSCNVRTCWHQLPAFHEVGDRLKQRYDAASLVKFNRQGTALVAANRRFKRPTNEDLVFFEPSPNYCEVFFFFRLLKQSTKCN